MTENEVQPINKLALLKKKSVWIPALILFLIIIGSLMPKDNSASDTGTNDQVTTDTSTTPADNTEDLNNTEPESVTPVETEDPEPQGPLETTSQSNARSQAESYISTMAFSRSGLIEQLKFEGYSTADATYAVDNIDVDWYEQAVLKAEEYLDTMPMSASSLYDQLVFEGFTANQAQHGVDVAYN